MKPQFEEYLMSVIMLLFALPLLSLLLVALLASWGIGTIFAWSFLLFALSLLLMLLFTVWAIKENKKDANKNRLYGLYGDSSLKDIGFLCKILLCIVIAITIFAIFVYFEKYLNLNYIFDEIVDKYSKITGTIIAVIIFSALVPIPYLLLNGCTNYYVNYIDKKILSLYNKPDGEYVIISNSAWSFLLPVLWTEVAFIIGRGIKAKKDGDYIELNGISAQYLPRPYDFDFGHHFSFGFCKDSSSYSSFHGFGKKQVAYNSRKEREEAYYNFGYYMIFTWDNGIWRFRITNRSLYSAKFDEEAYDKYNEYYWKQHSHDHLMGIYFGGVEHREEEYNIIYRIITQTGENKVIKKDIDKNYVVEYYHYDDPNSKQWFSTSDSISKITNTKEGYYHYQIAGTNYSVPERFNIKEFMQLKGINLRGLFTYGNEDDGAIVYWLNGNYSKCSWWRNE